MKAKWMIAACFAIASCAAWAQTKQIVSVDVRDYCDPKTFNAAVGPGACQRGTENGAITFNGFVAELGADKSVGAWRFAPSGVNAKPGALEVVKLKNNGGETHTFTRVKNFGGGFVPALNAASGQPTVAPECAKTVNGQLQPQPPSKSNIFLAPGDSAFGLTLGEQNQNAKFQCCIHPWMHAIINATPQTGR
jgi:hypothetical protein